MEEIGVQVAPNPNLFAAVHEQHDGEDWLVLFYLTTFWLGTPSVQEPEKLADCKFFAVKHGMLSGDLKVSKGTEVVLGKIAELQGSTLTFSSEITQIETVDCR